MDVKAIAEQVMAAVGEAPEKAQEFIADPKGAIEQLTGHALDEGQIAEVVEHVKSMITEGGAGLEGLDLGAIGEKLGGLVGEGSPLGGLLGGIFGKKE
ncbi:hypothetical protein C2L80_03935 [Rubneribacter badeniensis]|uniref:Homocitrate synthase n=1 Tax=Rubneribacter badeniensis TaxID=2070688 RepID=A0A2K2U6H7_9ACTN|nr:hypothetical protein [Rubneribacter badeniensis]OUO94231.1 hypothetical protein B5F41_08285 [Gordonibacter sp. An232A]PNV65945.1 hypothetical protein C2L80_03935 [Rubneribacter badeniensis]